MFPAPQPVPPSSPPSGPEIDDPIGIADDIQIMLDDEHRIPQIDQPLQHIEKLAYIVKVQAGRRLVEQIKSASGLALAKARWPA